MEGGHYRMYIEKPYTFFHHKALCIYGKHFYSFLGYASIGLINNSNVDDCAAARKYNHNTLSD